MSTRGGAWVIRQVSDNGMPVDMKYNTRFVHILFQLLPINILNWIGENKLNAMYDHTMYALKPTHRQVLLGPHTDYFSAWSLTSSSCCYSSVQAKKVTFKHYNLQQKLQYSI